jgi:hypothetical protein
MSIPVDSSPQGSNSSTQEVRQAALESHKRKYDKLNYFPSDDPSCNLVRSRPSSFKLPALNVVKDGLPQEDEVSSGQRLFAVRFGGTFPKGELLDNRVCFFETLKMDRSAIG